MTKIALFASGSGSNVQAIIDSVEQSELNAEIELVVCDRPQAYVNKRAADAGIEVFSFEAKSFSGKDQYEKLILEKLTEKKVEWMILAGYMRLIGPVLLTAYENRIVNIHPSLLPAFPGKDAVGQAIDYGVKIMGVTVHFVDEGMDTGPIIAQQAFPVNGQVDRDMIQKQIHQIEHDLYPATLQSLFK
ncbi:phosphoribosylglycinamide formyltransferase [Jeotgalibacillus campisalis]|uniref:Phosphoribosylglycinamide formyltransferase n=1 Tax=Jeotgalibacillus campisalis TaxID=220754 RepID=A0A0C2VDL9_9BACL|nr:phosphoribosylglycinamide formyltransferase [Jeotgalibacillus campisalis]KIL47002.1 phosphoribosylglycinamide formyltransferase [Jeotgalibacillus campisalis]